MCKAEPRLVVEDRAILVRSQVADTLRHAFMHLYRNAIDHGIEPPEERIAAGKSPSGEIRLDADLDAQHLCLVLRDDGRGLALRKLRAKAIAKGLVTGDESMTASDVANLIFAPGFSTAQAVTQVSGRGVGMDAVRGFIWAAPGHEIMVADYGSIEGRLAAWFAGEEWELEAYRALDRGEGAGIYELNAADIYQIPVERVTKAQRKVGKVRALACAYETGAGGIRKFARQEKIKLPPLYAGLWNVTETAAQRYVEGRYKERVAKHDVNCAALGREADHWRSYGGVAAWE